MARPVYHVLSTLPVAWWAGRRWGPLAAFVALIGGVGIDIDHLIDYALVRRSRQAEHLVVPLHGWEYPLVLLGLLASGAVARWPRVGAIAPARAAPPARRAPWPSWETLMVVLTVAWTMHLALDSATNGPRHPKFYSLLYRLRWAFNVRHLGWHEEFDLHGWAEQTPEPWWRHLY